MRLSLGRTRMEKINQLSFFFFFLIEHKSVLQQPTVAMETLRHQTEVNQRMPGPWFCSGELKSLIRDREPGS